MTVLSPIQPTRAGTHRSSAAVAAWWLLGLWSGVSGGTHASQAHISPAHWVAAAAAAARQSPSCHMHPSPRLESSLNACPRSSCDITLSSVHVPVCRAYAVRSAPPSPHLPPPAPCLVPMGSLPPHHRECSLSRLHTAQSAHYCECPLLRVPTTASAHYCECPLLRVLTTETPRACEAPPPRP